MLTVRMMHYTLCLKNSKFNNCYNSQLIYSSSWSHAYFWEKDCIISLVLNANLFLISSGTFNITYVRREIVLEFRIGPPVPVSRYTKYRDTATSLSGINSTGIEVTQYRHGRYWRWAHRQCIIPCANERLVNGHSVPSQYTAISPATVANAC